MANGIITLDNFREGLERSKSRVENMLPDPYKPFLQRFLDRAALTFRTSKSRSKLERCTIQSLVTAVVTAAEYGFALDDRFCYAIPYNNSVDDPASDNGRKIKIWECTATFDYKALVAVARRHRLVLDVRAQDVRENDEFDWCEENFEQKYRFRKCNGDRGSIVGAFAVVDFPNGGHRFEHMAIEELRKVRAASKSPDSPAWTNWENRMYCKAVTKRALSTVQDDPTLGSIIDADNREFDMEKIVVDAKGVSEVRRRTVDSLARELAEEVPRIESLPESMDYNGSMANNSEEEKAYILEQERKISRDREQSV